MKEKQKLITLLFLIPEGNDATNAMDLLNAIANKLGHFNCTIGEIAGLMYNSTINDENKKTIMDMAEEESFGALFIEAPTGTEPTDLNTLVIKG